MLSQIFNKISYKVSALKIPIINIESFLKGEEKSHEECKKVADGLRDYGCIVIKDPRVNQQENSVFLDMMESYFLKRSTEFYEGKKIEDIYPEYDYEVGATPEFKEKAKTNKSLIESLIEKNKPLTPMPSPHDAKWRYFWNIGNSEDNVSNQSPKDFPEWEKVMDKWGNHMINGCETVSEMAALGMGLEKNAFTSLTRNGPHKLAPTGSDLTKFGVGTVFAGFHYDFNFLTIHGKSRYPGLFLWLKTGEKITAHVPEGHLLVQAGREFEYLTGGHVSCGYHEVIYTEEVKLLKEKAIKEGQIPWRISSTLFSHVRYNEILKPIGKFATDESIVKYPAIKVKDFVEKEFDDIKRNI